ncbi:hypothetical protein [Microbulbifer mangrovi]|uniref:hypothetical protein n=1 Tax=Microbulbifer mangrovi TaxID=927787 RepID=UPI00117DE0C9|nr:hypothetical protein [Microbulbifer mangrovi]
MDWQGRGVRKDTAPFYLGHWGRLNPPIPVPNSHALYLNWAIHFRTAKKHTIPLTIQYIVLEKNQLIENSFKLPWAILNFQFESVSC